MPPLGELLCPAPSGILEDRSFSTTHPANPAFWQFYVQSQGLGLLDWQSLR